MSLRSNYLQDIVRSPRGYKIIADQLKRAYADDQAGLAKLIEHLGNGRDSSSPDPKYTTIQQRCGLSDVRRRDDGRYVCTVCRRVMDPNFGERVRDMCDPTLTACINRSLEE